VKILIVDDDDFALNVLQNTVARMGYTAEIAHDGREAMTILHRGEIRLVITDWDMPGMTGIDLCRMVRREDLSGYVYIIMLTGREGAKLRMEGLCAGADDFLNKPLDPEELAVCLKTSERILSLETRDLALFAMAKLAESRDAETGAHIERVQHYSRLIAQHLSPEVKACYGVDEEYIRLIYQTSPLHDLGKVAIPDNVLLKPGKLTNAEFAIMQTHTTIGAQTLDAALGRFPNARFLQMAHEIALTHHERFDGSGYPHGLAGQAIPLCGRIVAIADVYDAVTSRRIYKNPANHQQAKATILKDRGSHFDPEVVDAFLRCEAQIVAAHELLSDRANLTSPPVAIPPPPSREECSRAPCKILIVEDDPAVLAKLRELLAATGEIVYVATTGEEALKILSEQQPRVVISDWVISPPDGVELCRRVRHEQVCPEPVYFVMLTAHSNKNRLLDAYAAGVDDFVSKPFDPEELLVRIRAGIRSAKLHDELVRKAAASRSMNAELAIVNSRLERLSITDELTGLFNRRHAMFRLDEQWALAQRYGRPLTIAMVDIDHFKRINDTYGHDAGDVVLRQVAAILREETRGTDALCRVGGEELLIILPSQTIQEAFICAERYRTKCATHPFKINNVTIAVTISIGIATRMPHLEQFTDLLRAADQALYAAKRSGRNVVHSAEQSDEQNLSNAMPVATDPPISSKASVSPPVALDAVLKRCGGDAQFATAITERFRSQAGGEVHRIQKELEQGSTDNARRAAHSLKSMAAYMAADRVADLAKQIEELCGLNQLAGVPPLVVLLTSEVTRATTWIAQNTGALATRSA
jgi:putative two-component system response regulator